MQNIFDATINEEEMEIDESRDDFMIPIRSRTKSNYAPSRNTVSKEDSWFNRTFNQSCNQRNIEEIKHTHCDYENKNYKHKTFSMSIEKDENKCCYKFCGMKSNNFTSIHPEILYSKSINRKCFKRNIDLSKILKVYNAAIDKLGSKAFYIFLKHNKDSILSKTLSRKELALNIELNDKRKIHCQARKTFQMVSINNNENLMCMK